MMKTYRTFSMQILRQPYFMAQKAAEERNMWQ
jgi:hypothetical protein